MVFKIFLYKFSKHVASASVIVRLLNQINLILKLRINFFEKSVDKLIILVYSINTIACGGMAQLARALGSYP